MHTTVRYHLTPADARHQLINKLQGLVGMQTGAATVENSMEASQKTKNGTSS